MLGCSCEGEGEERRTAVENWGQGTGDQLRMFD